MNVEKQLKYLKEIGNQTHFHKKISEDYDLPIRSNDTTIFQMNIGRKCNLACKHCHVDAGPNRKELMSREIFEKCLDVIKESNFSVVDITGGAPEMNPHLEWFLDEINKLGKRLIVRSNLVILLEDIFHKYIDIYIRNKVELIASLPDYIESKSDRQRGSGMFKKTINVIQKLNSFGYGKDKTGLILDLVHNSVGAYLPGSQEAIEYEYRERLKKTMTLPLTNYLY